MDNHQENRLDNMNEITIKALSPDLEKDYFDFLIIVHSRTVHLTIPVIAMHLI
jgi:hypothetical protein